MRSAILRALTMSWVIDSVVAPTSFTRRDDEVVDDVGHDRIEARGRLVEEDDLGIGGDGAGQADALLHAAGQFRRAEIGDIAGEADLGQLLDGDVLGLGRATPRPWISPKATFSQTGRLSNSAPPWNSMPNFFIRGSRAAPRRRVTSSPSTRIVPSSGVRMPRMHLIITDLPVPEPPMTTMEDCLSDRRDRRRPARPWARSAS